MLNIPITIKTISLRNCLYFEIKMNTVIFKKEIMHSVLFQIVCIL